MLLHQQALTHACTHIRTHKHAMQSIGEKGTAQTAWEKSCYFKIDFKISEDAMMYEAVQR